MFRLGPLQTFTRCLSCSHYKGNRLWGEGVPDGTGQEKSHTCLSRYQVSLSEGFEVSLITLSHLSWCPQHVFLGGVGSPSSDEKPTTMSWILCWWITCAHVHFSCLPFIPNSIRRYDTFPRGVCECSLLVIRDENIGFPEWRRCIF